MDKVLELMNIDKEYCYGIGFCAEDLDDVCDEETPFDPATYEAKFEINTDMERRSKPLPEDIDLTNKPVNDGKDDFIFTHKNLPRIPFSMLVNGSRDSGKSVVSQSTFKFLLPYFDKVILYSPTADLDAKWKICFEKLGVEYKPGDNVFYDYNEMLLSKQMRKLRKINKGKKTMIEKFRTLFIFDDMISQIPKNKKYTKFNRLTLNNRHYGASIIIISQSFMMIDSNFRKNCSQICLWKTDFQEETDNYIKQLSGCLGRIKKDQRENFLDLYEFATEEPHSFLYINYHQPEKENRFHRNFDEILRFEDECEEEETHKPESIEEIKEEIKEEKLDSDTEEIGEEIIDEE